MDHDLTYKTMLYNIIPNKLFNDMACEACSAKFTLFKRKRQCKDCLRFYCGDCVIRRGDRVLSCDTCNMLSRRPLIRSQVLMMKSKDLKQYLAGKKVSLTGCVEREDLINILMIYANGADSQMDNPVTDRIPNYTQSRERPTNIPDLSSRRSRSPPVTVREASESPADELPSELPPRIHSDVEIIEILSDDDQTLIQGPEPVVTEQEVDQEVEVNRNTNSDGPTESPSDHAPASRENRTRTGRVKLTDIHIRSDLDHLNVKQLKDLLRTNRVDFHGCVERSELLDRALRLWDSHSQSQEGHTADETSAGEGSYEESLCKICWDSPINCILLECAHMACCLECGKQMSECPICRQYVVRVVRFFKA